MNADKKAQIWSLDLIIATTIFLIGIITVYLFSVNLSSEADENLNTLLYEGNLIASNILSNGSPSNWQLGNIDDTIMPGILTDGKIDASKLAKFDSFLASPQNVAKIKIKLNTKFNFCFNVSGKEFGDDYGKICTIDMPADVSNKIKVTRFTIYNNITRKFELEIWS
jgi:hypothetical protein